MHRIYRQQQVTQPKSGELVVSHVNTCRNPQSWQTKAGQHLCFEGRRQTGHLRKTSQTNTSQCGLATGTALLHKLPRRRKQQRRGLRLEAAASKRLAPTGPTGLSSQRPGVLALQPRLEYYPLPAYRANFTSGLHAWETLLAFQAWTAVYVQCGATLGAPPTTRVQERSRDLNLTKNPSATPAHPAPAARACRQRDARPASTTKS